MSDQREAPGWMREACEVHTGDLLDLAEARAAVGGCTHVIHLAAIVGGIANFHKLPHTLLEVNNGLYNAVFRAALDERVERLVYVSSSMVFERATEFPTTEEHLLDCPAPRSAYGFSKLAGEVYCRALHDEHGLPYTICRPFNAYGPGELPDDEPGHRAHGPRPDPQGAGGPAAAADLRLGRADAHAHARGRHRRRDRHRDGHPAGENEDFNVSASEELTVAEIARVIWEACGEDPAEFELEHLPSFEVDVQRRWPSVEKARAAARLGGADRPARRDRRHGASGCASASSPLAAGERARVRHRRRAASPGATCSPCCPTRWRPARDELDLLDAGGGARRAAPRRARDGLPPGRARVGGALVGATPRRRSPRTSP